MGQYYVFANLTKSQSMHSMLQKALEILANGSYLPWLQLFLLDLGDSKLGQSSLQNNCLEVVSNSDPSSAATDLLPKTMQKKLDLTFLTQQFVGKWAGDRLIITGDYSTYSPFPPNGEWKEQNLFEFVYESGQFSKSHASEVYEQFKTNQATLLEKLGEFCEGKYHKVVNLDKKEYLDPQAYKAGEKTVCDMVHTDMKDEQQGVMAGLIITLIHSTGSGGGDLPHGVTSQGRWAGDRIVICTAEQLDDFESYTNVSNPSDVEFALNN